MNISMPLPSRLQLFRDWKAKYRDEGPAGRKYARRARMLAFWHALHAPKYLPTQPFLVTQDTRRWYSPEFLKERQRIAMRQINAGWYGGN